MTKRAIRISQSKALSLLQYEGTAPLTSLVDSLDRLSLLPLASMQGMDREYIHKTSAIVFFCPMNHFQWVLLWSGFRTMEDAQKPSKVFTRGSYSSNRGGIDQGDPTCEVLTTTRDTTPYTRRPRASREVVIRSTSPISISIPSAGKEIMTEPKKPAKAKVQEQMSLQLAIELQEEFVYEDQSIREQIERDAEIARIHAEEYLIQMINELDKSNVMINKHMAEYEEAENDLTIEEKTELITELINYQKDFARIKKYQAQQQRLASKSERRKFYTSVLRSHAGWKTKDLRGMTFYQLEEKFIPAKRLKTSDVSAQEQQESDNQDEIINLQQLVVLVREETSVNITPSVVKVPICDWKFYKDKLRKVYQIFKVGQAPKVYPYFEFMLKDFDRDDLVTLWKLVKDRFKTKLPKSNLEKCLFWPLKVMFEPISTDLLWQFKAPIKSWKMYKSCKVHCLSMEGMIIYMLDDVEYPFQKTTLKKMLDHKCEVSEFNEDVIQMINLIRGQLKKE
ncbi:hypothetical protein Tco_1375827 [Tanacetum coccineum]